MNLDGDGNISIPPAGTADSDIDVAADSHTNTGASLHIKLLPRKWRHKDPACNFAPNASKRAHPVLSQWSHCSKTFRGIAGHQRQSFSPDINADLWIILDEMCQCFEV